MKNLQSHWHCHENNGIYGMPQKIVDKWLSNTGYNWKEHVRNNMIMTLRAVYIY
jgi:hypothetical protein